MSTASILGGVRHQVIQYSLVGNRLVSDAPRTAFVRKRRSTFYELSLSFVRRLEVSQYR